MKRMERDDTAPRPDQEGFGESELGEAQSSNPPADPEMIEDEPEAAEGGVERVGGDQDAEAPASAEQVAEDERRDQAEG